MDDHNKELEAMNAAFEMRLDEAYDEIGRYRRKIKNALLIVEKSRMSQTIKNNLRNELQSALDQ